MQLTETLPGAPQRPSPGRLFFQAYQRDGLDARVDIDYTITESVSSTRRKPRRPTRYLFRNLVDLSAQPRRAYWHETTATPDEPAVLHGDQRRELANHFHATPI